MLLMGTSTISMIFYGYFQVRKLSNYQRIILGKSMMFFFTNNLNLVVSTSSGGDHPIVTLNGWTLCGPVDRNAQSFTGQSPPGSIMKSLKSGISVIAAKNQWKACHSDFTSFYIPVTKWVTFQRTLKFPVEAAESALHRISPRRLWCRWFGRYSDWHHGHLDVRLRRRKLCLLRLVWRGRSHWLSGCELCWLTHLVGRKKHGDNDSPYKDHSQPGNSFEIRTSEGLKPFCLTSLQGTIVSGCAACAAAGCWSDSAAATVACRWDVLLKNMKGHCHLPSGTWQWKITYL